MAIFLTKHVTQALSAAATSNAKQNGIKVRSFMFTPKSIRDKPKLVIIGGCTGTGKSTFGMSVALEQGILKCVSTDTVRAVMRSFIPQHISPALHRSSYESNGIDDTNPVKSWKETCNVLEPSLSQLIEDSINRRASIVLEGVSIIPSTKWVQTWEQAGGVATGCLLTVQDEEAHRSLLLRRGIISGGGQKEKDDKKIQSFDRIRLIQEEMIQLAQESNWLLIEQKLEPDPLDIISEKLTFDDTSLRDVFVDQKMEDNDNSNILGDKEDLEQDHDQQQQEDNIA